MEGTQGFSSIYDLGGKPSDWEIKQLWESATQYYLVAVNRVLNRTTFCTKDGRPSVTKVLYSSEE